MNNERIIGEIPYPKIQYEYDPYGTSVKNLVKNEVHTVSLSRFRDYYLVIPQFAPFFVRNFKVFYRNNTNSDLRELKEDVDFTFCLPYKGAIEQLGLAVYGGITLNNLDIDGIMYLQYQTMGGDQLVDRNAVLQVLIENVYNPRSTLWDYITDTPNLFPPEAHDIDLSDVMKLDDLVKALDRVTKAIVDKGISQNKQIEEFLKTINIPEYMKHMELFSKYPLEKLYTRLDQLEYEVKVLKNR